MVWTPSEFWIDGKTWHCGVDVFEMMKEGRLEIANMIETVKPKACAALRPTDPARIRPKLSLNRLRPPPPPPLPPPPPASDSADTRSP